MLPGFNLTLIPFDLPEVENNCSFTPPCPPLNILNDCDSISLSLPSGELTNWNVDGTDYLNVSSIAINDINCHTIIYYYNEIACSTDFKACLAPSTLTCSNENKVKNTSNNIMTRWTLDNRATEFANAQKQMKDGEKHTLCYEKFNEKKGQFEKITCEDVQST